VILTSISNGLEKCLKMMIFTKRFLRPVEKQMVNREAMEQETLLLPSRLEFREINVWATQSAQARQPQTSLQCHSSWQV